MNTKILVTLNCLIVLSCLGCASIPLPEVNPETQTPNINIETQTPEIGDSREDLFQSLIPIEDMNQSIQITIPESLNNDFRMGHTIRILVENTTEFDFIHPFALKPDIYACEMNTWNEIENITNYIGQAQEIVEASGFSIATAVPKPPKYDEPVEVRFVLKGDLVDKNGNIIRSAGAYIDILLVP